METTTLRILDPAAAPETFPHVLTVCDGPELAGGREQFTGPTCELITVRTVVDAYQILEEDQAIAIVIADLGKGTRASIEFLAEVRTQYPASIRILLAGEPTSLATAAAAVNNAGVFRLLVKPFDRHALVVAVEEGLRIRRRSQADRTLLQTTLMASVNMLAEVLAISAPAAYQRASFARACVSWTTKQLRWPDAWIYEIAAALSQIGRVTLKGDEGPGINHEEIACNMVMGIPKLENAAEMIRYQNADPPADAMEEVQRGSSLLRAALLMEEMIADEVPVHQIAASIKRRAPKLSSKLIETVTRFRVDLGDHHPVFAKDLCEGWIVEQDVMMTDGTLVLSKNHSLSEAVLIALRRLSDRGSLKEPILVRAPSESEEPSTPGATASL